MRCVIHCHRWFSAQAERCSVQYASRCGSTMWFGEGPPIGISKNENSVYSVKKHAGEFGKKLAAL